MADRPSQGAIALEFLLVAATLMATHYALQAIRSVLRGRALTGAAGNRQARIFIHSMQAELVSVAGIYRNFEQDLPAPIPRAKPAHVD